MRLSTIAYWAALTLVSAPADAAPGPPPGAHRKAPVAAAAAAPSPVKLWLDVPSAVGLWTMHLSNEGAVPVVVVADARLLRLDVTARGAARARKCELPTDMRPDDDLQRPLVLAPQH